MAEPLLDKVREAIGKSGFPLELRVADLLRRRGYHVANNLYYVDQDEGKGREIDIRALKNFKLTASDDPGYVRHCLLIECKKSTDKPWVVFVSPQNAYDADIYRKPPAGLVGYLAGASNEKFVSQLRKLHPFFMTPTRGRSYFEPFKGKGTDDAIRSSLMTSAKATVAMTAADFAGKATCFYYPMVVLDGLLFEVDLETRETRVQEADYSVVSFFYESIKYKSVQFLIPIVIERALPAILDALDRALELLGRECETDPGRLRKGK